jgi:GT2 family glycosyltransferase
MPELTLLFVNYNCAALIRRCVASALPFLPSDCEILAVDNASQQADLQLLEQTERLTVVRSPVNLGFGGAMNLAASSAHGRWIILMNPDLVVESDIFTPLLQHLQEDPACALSAPALIDESGRPIHSWNVPEDLFWEFAKTHYLQGLWRHIALRRFQQRYGTSRPWPVGFVMGACMCLKREDFLSLGGFDSRFFMNGEDVELCDRIWAQGRSVHLLPWLRLRHDEGGVQRTNWRRYMFHRFQAFWNYDDTRYKGWRLLVARFFWFESLALRLGIGLVLCPQAQRSRLSGYLDALRWVIQR